MASVLVVLDDDDTCQAVTDCLGGAGHVVKCAHHGQAALLALGNEIPDVLILGLATPKMNSTDFLEVMRSYLRWGKIPVILLATHTKEMSAKQAKTLGVREIFLKSNYRPKNLLAAINTLQEKSERN